MSGHLHGEAICTYVNHSIIKNGGGHSHGDGHLLGRIQYSVRLGHRANRAVMHKCRSEDWTGALCNSPSHVRVELDYCIVQSKRPSHIFTSRACAARPTGPIVTLRFSRLFVSASVTVWGGLGMSQWQTGGMVCSPLHCKRKTSDASKIHNRQ